jgi:hypothetical protein
MKKIVKKSLLLVMIVPLGLNAFGMGVSVPFYSNVQHEQSSGYGTQWEEEGLSGYGLVLDSNIGKNKLYNYRLNIESNRIKVVDGIEYDKTAIVNTFGFALYRNKRVRVFMGPRLNIGFEKRQNNEGIEISLAPVVLM